LVLSVLVKNYSTSLNLNIEITKEGRIGYSLPEFDVPEVDLQELIPAGYIREQEPELPELSELDIMRHSFHYTFI